MKEMLIKITPKLALAVLQQEIVIEKKHEKNLLVLLQMIIESAKRESREEVIQKNTQ